MEPTNKELFTILRRMLSGIASFALACMSLALLISNQRGLSFKNVVLLYICLNAFNAYELERSNAKLHKVVEIALGGIIKLTGGR